MSAHARQAAAVESLREGLGLDRRQAELEVGHLLSGKSATAGGLPEGFEAMVRRRSAGAPLAHILGTAEFMDLELACGPGALVPRPETEVLVEAVLEAVTDSPITIADLGTGTGAIAAAVARHRPRATVVACERDPAALELARRNFSELGLSNVESFEGDWRDLDAALDVAVSNPPYVTSALCRTMEQAGIMHDPLGALDGGADGLDSIRSVLRVAGRLLRPGGEMFLEHGVGQHPPVRKIAEQSGLEPSGSRRDLQGLKRVFRATRKS